MKIISNTAKYLVEKPVAKMSNSKAFQKHAQKYIENSAKYIAGVGVVSIVAKDAFGTYLYVTQSLNNKEIPKEKRGFVAALDLANGVLMNITQLGMFFGFSKFQEGLFNKMFGKSFNKENSKNALDILSKKSYEKLNSLEKINVLNGLKGKSLENFKVITSLVASAIVAKRVIVPFLSTPAASFVKKHILNDPAKNQADNTTQNNNLNNNKIDNQSFQLQQPQIKITKENAFEVYKSLKANA